MSGVVSLFSFLGEPVFLVTAFIEHYDRCAEQLEEASQHDGADVIVHIDNGCVAALTQ